MKRITLLALTLGMSLSSFAQGYFNFNNLGAFDGTANALLPFIAAGGQAGEGAPGEIIGSPGYTIGFLWNANLSLNDAAAFRQASGTTVGATTTGFFSTTGDAAGGAGVYDGGTSGILAGTAGGQHVLIQAVAWWSGAGGFSSYDAAVAAGNVNVGRSALIDLRLAAGADPVIADLSALGGFGVAPVPEPSTFALAGLGAAAMLIFRRNRK